MLKMIVKLQIVSPSTFAAAKLKAARTRASQYEWRLPILTPIQAAANVPNRAARLTANINTDRKLELFSTYPN